MKWFAIFLVILLIDELESANKSSLRQVFSNVSDFLGKKNHLVTVIVGDFPKHQSDAILSQLDDVPHNVDDFQINLKPFQLKSSAIVLLDSIASLINFNSRAFLPFISMSQQAFIHIPNATFEDIARLRANRKKEVILQCEYFLVEEEDSVKLLTVVHFTPEHCHQRQLIEVNQFDKKVGKWLHGTYWIDKFSTFHGCTMNVTIGGGVPEFIDLKVDYQEKSIVKCAGYICAALDHISSKLNFKSRANKDIMGKTTFPETTRPHLVLAYRPLSAVHFIRSNSVDPGGVYTRPVYFKDHFIAISPGEEYNGYEKLALPFDEETWMWLGITFASAFATIFVLKFVKPHVKLFVIGRRTKNPMLNVIRAFFGISQIVCPGRNFARYLLMLFILFSLIIRTAYQGVMFSFLQEEMRKPTVETIDEMIANNFTFYMQRGFLLYFGDMDLAKRGKIVDKYTDEELVAAYERLYTPGTKTGVFYHREMYLHIKTLLNRTEPPKLLKDRYMLELKVLYFRTDDMFYEPFDKNLQLLIEGGFLDYHINKPYMECNPERFKEHKEPFKVLTLSELEAGFVISLVPLVLSFFVFFIEWMPTIKNLIVFEYILEGFFKQNH